MPNIEGIRERNKRAKHSAIGNAYASYEAYEDEISILLDAVDRLTAERDAAVAECEFLMRNAPLRGVGLEDGSRWKARAEALERALRSSPIVFCDTCAHDKKPNCKYRGKCKPYGGKFYWQFDAARFAGGKEANRNDQC